MAKKWLKVAAVATSVVMASSIAVGLAGCKKEKPIPDAGLKKGTYRTSTTTMPSDWNEFSYTDNNDTQIMNYIGSSFFEFDFKFEDGKKFKDNGEINAEAIVDGEFSVEYSAATALKDVTSSVASKWGYTAEQKKDGGYAWEITLRKDLKWDDGTPIEAADFVYSMQEQLNPDFFFTRASTWYNQIIIKNAKNYLYHTTTATYETVGSQGYKSNAEAVAAGHKIYIDVWASWGAEGYVDSEGNECPQWLDITDEHVYRPAGVEAGSEKDDPTSGKMVYDAYVALGADFDVGGAQEDWVAIYVQNSHMDVNSFDQVGLYADGKYKVVICLDSPIKLLDENNELTYLAPYMMNSLPLVKKDLFESCKKEPVLGSNLWTSNYNSSKETTASWGPYKLEEFQRDTAYKLTRNEHWYGYGLNQYANQYNVSAIECRKITETPSRWTAFFGGLIDSIGLDNDHSADYRNSKYTYYSAGAGIFGMNLYADLDTLKKSSHNSGVLAIDDFRKAISLFLDRDDYNASTSVAMQTALGLINLSSYYDVENGLTYASTQQSKEALLRVYGFTQNSDGTWTDGTNTFSDYKDAFEAMNGMNPTLAKQLLENAYTELTTNAEKYGYDASKKITLVYGTSADNAAIRRDYDYIVSFFNELVKGTSFEGKIVISFDASFGNGWADSFKNGEYEIASGTGFTGSALDPYNFIGVYIDPTAGLMYSTWWNTTTEMKSFTLPTVEGFAQSGQTLEMSIYNWYCCLNGTATSNNQAQKYNWGSGFAPSEVRLAVLAMLEEHILGKYYTIQTTSQYTAAMLGAKFSYVVNEENYFMGFGGMRYMLVNYTDAEWEEFVSQRGTLEEYYKEEAAD